MKELFVRSRIVPPQLYTDDVCDWWKLRPKLGQVCDIDAVPL